MCVCVYVCVTQVSIVVGRKGSAIKRVGEQARKVCTHTHTHTHKHIHNPSSCHATCPRLSALQPIRKVLALFVALSNKGRTARVAV